MMLSLTKRKEKLLTLNRDVPPREWGVEAGNRLREARDKQKTQILTICALVYPTLKRHLKATGTYRTQFHQSAQPQLRVSFNQGGAGVHSDQRERGEETVTHIDIVLTHWNQHKHHSRCSSTAVFPGTVCSLAEELLNNNKKKPSLSSTGQGRGQFSVVH